MCSRGEVKLCYLGLLETGSNYLKCKTQRHKRLRVLRLWMSTPTPVRIWESYHLESLNIDVVWVGRKVITRQGVWVIDQVCPAKMMDISQALASCLFMEQDGVDVHKQAKKERGHWAAILIEHTWSRIYCMELKKNTISLQDTAGGIEPPCF